MRLVAIIAATMATFAAAAPVDEVEASQQLGNFHVKNFYYYCTSTCQFELNLSVGPTFPNHPGFSKEVKCGGKFFKEFDGNSCHQVNGEHPEQAVAAYINKTTSRLHLQYLVDYGNEDKHFWYTGSHPVHGSSFNLNFTFPETHVKAEG